MIPSASVIVVACLLSSANGDRVHQAEATSRVAQTDQVIVELIAADRPAARGQDLWVGIHFKIASGWHIYWKNPGDSGSPPKVSWTVSPKTSIEPLAWPTPSRLPLGPLVNYGYEDDVVLPARVLAARDSHPALTVSANLHWVACSTECVPGRAQLTITIPASSSRSGLSPTWATLLAKWRRRVPEPIPSGSRVRASFGAHTFVLSVGLNRAVTHVAFFPLDESEIDDSAPQAIDRMTTELHIRLRQSSQMAQPPKRLRGVLVLDSNTSFMVDTAVTLDRPLPKSTRRPQ